MAGGRGREDRAARPSAGAIGGDAGLRRGEIIARIDRRRSAARPSDRRALGVDGQDHGNGGHEVPRGAYDQAALESSTRTWARRSAPCTAPMPRPTERSGCSTWLTGQCRGGERPGGRSGASYGNLTATELVADQNIASQFRKQGGDAGN